MPGVKYVLTAVRNGNQMEREFVTDKLMTALKVQELWASYGWLVSMEIVQE